jgi:hypothetical protein
MRRASGVILAAGVLAAAAASYAPAQEPPLPYFSWSASQAGEVIDKMLVKGRVAGTRRILNTEQALSYKLRALWLTPDVVGASARQLQLTERLTEAQTRALIQEAEVPGYTIIMIDLDPDEGSGVIPPDWGAFLGPRAAGKQDGGAWVRGLDKPALGQKRALAKALRRNYDYDRFWMAFPLETDAGAPVFAPGDREAELTVQIRGREERVRWPIPDSIRALLTRKAAAAPAAPGE